MIESYTFIPIFPTYLSQLQRDLKQEASASKLAELNQHIDWLKARQMLHAKPHVEASQEPSRRLDHL